MGVTRESGLKALHVRHHVNRGIVREGCTFCALPNVKGVKKENKPALQQAQEPDHYELLAREAQANVEKSLERDRLWSCAQSGMSALDTMRVLDIPQLALFVTMVEGYFHKPWIEVLAQAKLVVKRDLTTSAIREAQNGDTRLLLKLMDNHFFDGWMQDERAEGLRTATTEELEQRLLALFPAVRSRYEQFQSDTLKVTQATDEDVRDFEEKKSAEYVVKLAPIEAETKVLEPIQEQVKEPDEGSKQVKQSTPDEDRTRVDDSSPTPCTYTPPPAFPLSPQITRGDLR